MTCSFFIKYYLFWKNVPLQHVPVTQHDLTPRIYVLYKITLALKFMFDIN